MCIRMRKEKRGRVTETDSETERQTERGRDREIEREKVCESMSR